MKGKKRLRDRKVKAMLFELELSHTGRIGNEVVQMAAYKARRQNGFQEGYIH